MISATVNVVHTECKPIEINFCILRFVNKHTSPDYYKPFLKKWANFNLTYDQQEKSFKFNMGDHDCFVLQFEEEEEELPATRFCHLSLSPDDMSDSGHVELYILGSEGSWLNISTFNQSVWFDRLNNTEEFCCFNKTIKQIDKYSHEWFYGLHLNARAFFHKGDIYAKIKIKLQVYFHPFIIKTFLEPTSQTWLDIIVKRDRGISNINIEVQLDFESIKVTNESLFLTRASNYRGSVLLVQLAPSNVTDEYDELFHVNVHINDLIRDDIFSNLNDDRSQIHWQSTLILSRFKPISYISLNNLIRTVELSFKPTNTDTNVCLKTTWLDNIYSNYASTTYVSFNSSKQSEPLLNISTNSTVFILIRSKFTQWGTTLIDRYCDFREGTKFLKSVTQNMMSWYEASEVCKELNTSLPYVTGGKDLEHVLAVLALLPEFPSMEGIFIGLHIKIHNQVMFFLLLFPWYTCPGAVLFGKANGKYPCRKI